MSNKNVSLGGASNPKEKKEQMIYMNIPTTILLMMDIQAHPPAKKYIEALSDSIKKSISKKVLVKEILKMFDVKTVDKLISNKPQQYGILTEIFGNEIW